MKDFKKLGHKVQQARSEMKMSQNKLAAQIGVDKSLLSKVENGHYQPTAIQLQAIIDILGVPGQQALEMWSLSGRPSGPIVQAIGNHNSSDRERKNQMQDIAKIPAQAPNLNVSVDPNRTPVLYSDVMAVMSTDYGITLQFAQMVGVAGNANIAAQVGVSFEHARKIADAIINELEKHER